MAVQQSIDGGADNASVFQSDLPLETKLERARTELLDLSARNRLLNMPRSGKAAKSLEIIDEQAAELFRLLVKEQRPLTFLPGRRAEGAVSDEGEEILELAQPDDDGMDDRGIANRHTDTRLQSRLTPAGLQKRLLDLYYDARTLEEEQGVNILFLALGSLKWIDPNNAKNVRFAPLILIPVSLERGNAAEKFKLRWRQEEVAANLSLEAFLDRVHGLKLPSFERADDLDVAAYIADVAEAVAVKADWSVQQDDIVLGFFSFAKFLMYRDLDPTNWPAGSKLSEHNIIRSLVCDGFEANEPHIDDDAQLDAVIPPADLTHIVDSDSSQTMAVHEARHGRSIVIQGPPGTGKSQTIANLIGAAVADGKKVLFVAEKMAALEVVKRRLDNNGVGDVCLELHSNKANKRAVLEELRRTWELGVPKGEDLSSLNARLAEARDQLNAHAERLHRPTGSAGFTPYEVIGHLTRLRQAGQQPSELQLLDPTVWSREDLRIRSALLDELVGRIEDIGVPAQHPWRGIKLDSALPIEVDRVTNRVGQLASRTEQLHVEINGVAAQLETTAPRSLSELDQLSALAARVAQAPQLDAVGLGSAVWHDQGEAIGELLAKVKTLAALRQQLRSTYTSQAWSADLSETIQTFALLPSGWALERFEDAAHLVRLIPTLQESARQLAAALGRETVPRDVRGVTEMVKVAERVASAPDADPEALAASLWETGIDRAADLADTVRSLAEAQAIVGDSLSDAGWSVDLSDERRVLGSHGTSFFRYFSSQWRAANRTVRSYLADPKMPLERQLAVLDAQGRCRTLRGRIAEEREFGQAAFGSAWRGDQTPAAPMQALVDWMRSLKGLGAEPRLLAGKSPDKIRLGDLAKQVSAGLEPARQHSCRLWDALGEMRVGVLPGSEDALSTDLTRITAAAESIVRADQIEKSIALREEAGLGQRLEDLRHLEEGQQLVADVAERASLGEAAFGADWKGEESDEPKLASAVEWIAANPDINQLASRLPDRIALSLRCVSLADSREALISDIDQLLLDLRAGDDSAIQPGKVADTDIDLLEEALAAWRDQSEQLSKWVAYRTRADRAKSLGLGDLISRLHVGDVEPQSARPTFEMAYFETIFSSQVDADAALGEFDGDLHNRLVQSFSDLDKQRIKQSALEVVRAHHRNIPSRIGGRVGPLGVLKSEMARRRGHMPIRQLMQKAAPAIQALKPVFMMSPLSVAQFLQPGCLEFDLLVMDEASQIQPVDALGAIGRCKQVVVVGDPQQLPPTSFFSKMTGNVDAPEDEDGTARVADIESILGLFTARGLPMRMLRWHYRSRHESLIAVSNRQFYENKLFIVPSPFTAQAGLGLRFHHISNGIFETGTTRTNPIEAKAVAQAIVDHAINHPERSLGVVAFSAAQRRAIFDQLELLRRALPPEQEAFFQAHHAEPFFVKNLENVQGDERDVIFISVGYGPTAPGLKPPMRFGPLGQEGGERRLNVLISRAKRRTEIFSSMTDEDIEQDFASTRKGVFAFKMFMHFARTGKMSMAEATARDHDSMFEAQVAEALHARGYQVHRQVGLAGFFIDLAIADPERADRYLLGIECDGAAYHEARSARDRDRLRQAILEDHGWIIHRLWSTDWFRRPKAELDRVVVAIEAAKAELISRGEREQRVRPARLEIVSVDREHVTEMGLVATEAPDLAPAPYVEAKLTKPSHVFADLHDTPTGILTQLAEQVVAIEGPVHLDEITNRLRDAWGLRRAGGRIQDAVERAIAVAVRQQRLIEKDDFYSIPHKSPIVRDRCSATSLSLRKPEMLPPAEIRLALLQVIERNFGATEDQVVQAAARAFGFKSTSGQLRDVIGQTLQRMLGEGELQEGEGLLTLGPNAPAPRDTVAEPTSVERLIGLGESENLEFKQSLRWDIRQQTVNKKLEDVTVKTVAALGNHAGGTLLIGVCDDGTVCGIDADLATFQGSRDKLELHLTELLNAHLPKAFRAMKVRISFPDVSGTPICRIDVDRSRQPLFVTIADGQGNKSERLFIRAGNSSHEVPPSQIPGFVRERFEFQG